MITLLSRAWVSNLLLCVLIAALFPISSIIEDQMASYFLHILILIGINIILVTSLNLINGITGQFSLGHAVFMAIGAYVTASVMLRYRIFGNDAMVAIPALLILSGLIAATAGLVVGLPSLRLRGDYLAIATLGFAEMVNIVITQQEKIGQFPIGASTGLSSVPGFPAGTRFFWVYSSVAITVVCIWRLVYSAKGKAFVAVREDEIAASASGVDTTYYKVLAFVIGAFFAGVAGGLTALTNQSVVPRSFDFMRSVEIVVMVVLGGSGSITGGIIAAIVLTYLPEQLRFLEGAWRMLLYAVLLVMFMLVRPAGLLGRRELWWTRKRNVPAATPIV